MPKSLRKVLFATLSFVAFFATARTSSAQDTTFSLDRLRVGGAPDDGVGVWRPQMGERERFFGQFLLGFSYNPFRIEQHIEDDRQAQRMSSVSGSPVETQLTGYADVGVEILDRLSFQVMFPVTFVQTGNATASSSVIGADDNVDLATIAPGDTRLEVRGIIFRTDDRVFKLGANAFLNAPSGDEKSFTGDRTTSGGLGVATELDFKDVFFVLDTGVNLRPPASVNDFSVEHEWTWGFGAFLPLRDNTIRLGAELFGSTGIVGNSAFKGQNTPLEWMAEARFALDDKKQLYVGGNGGTRVTPGYAPDFRLGALIGYWFNVNDPEPISPPKKLDANRINDNVDTDKDGYPDNMDLCPTEPEDGKPPFTTDGCPAPPDKDGDGIPDSKDQCPEVPEDKDGVDDKDGCPEDDADKDGVPDAQDKCPKEPGEASKDPEKNGCPQFIRRISGSNEIQVLKRVEFVTGSAKLSAASFPILDEVYRLLVANPEINLMAIEGHTDDRGADDMNLKLSKDRAASCLEYLVKKGIVTGRLSSDGFGETKPIASNDTNDGRQTNRRVEFHIRSQSVPGETGAPTAPPGVKQTTPPKSGEPVPGD